MVCDWHEDGTRCRLAEQAALKARQGVRYPVLEGLMVADPETLEPVPRDGAAMGEIFMRGNVVMKGYLKNPKATGEAFAGGWFHTGDLGVVHPDGYIEIKDRSKDIIISGGENISTIEVESVLYRHPAVLEAAVVARPDASWGETPCAFVTLKPGATATAGGDHRLLPRASGALQGAEDGGLRSACPRPRPERCRNMSCASRRRAWPEARGLSAWCARATRFRL